MTTENLVSVASICVHHVFGRISSSVSITTYDRDLTAVRRPLRPYFVKTHIGGQCWVTVTLKGQLSSTAAIRIHRPELYTTVILPFTAEDQFAVVCASRWHRRSGLGSAP